MRQIDRSNNDRRLTKRLRQGTTLQTLIVSFLTITFEKGPKFAILRGIF